MPSKKYMTVGVKVSEKEYSELELIANRENIKISAMLRLFIQAVINGDIELEKGELKMPVNPHNHADYEISEEDFQENLRYKELRFDKLLAAFEKRKHPDHVIRQEVEQMITALLDSPDYNPRRGGNDWGA